MISGPSASITPWAAMTSKTDVHSLALPRKSSHASTRMNVQLESPLTSSSLQHHARHLTLQLESLPLVRAKRTKKADINKFPSRLAVSPEPNQRRRRPFTCKVHLCIINQSLYQVCRHNEQVIRGQVSMRSPTSASSFLH